MEEFTKVYPDSEETTKVVTISFSEYKDMLTELVTLRLECEKLKGESLINWSKAHALAEKLKAAEAKLAGADKACNESDFT